MLIINFGDFTCTLIAAETIAPQNYFHHFKLWLVFFLTLQYSKRLVLLETILLIICIFPKELNLIKPQLLDFYLETSFYYQYRYTRYSEANFASLQIFNEDLFSFKITVHCKTNWLEIHASATYLMTAPQNWHV